MDECIIKTLSYFDIFDYPLSFSELKKYGCCFVDMSDQELYDILDAIPVIQEDNGYYYFLGRQSLVEKRVDRNEISIEKFAKAKVVAKILSYIPTIKYIGVSGSLSMNNAALTDDIDLFFITSANTLWITRFLVSVTLMASKQKRKKLSHNNQDKICPNMFMDERNLAFAQNRKSLYTAHEIVQLKTLYDKGDTYAYFISKNKWVADYFPNLAQPQLKRRRKVSVISKIITPFEKLLFQIQKMYMQKDRSKEVITPTKALFHPINRQKIIMDMYAVRCKRYKKLYMDNLWVDREEVRFYMDEKKIRILN